MSSNYNNSSDIFNNVYLRTSKQLNVYKVLTVDYSTNSYSFDDSKNLGVMLSTILASVDLLDYRTKNITLINNGPDNLDEVKIQASPNDSDWEDVDVVSFAGLSNGASKSINITGSRKYYRMVGNSVGSSSVDIYLNGILI